MQEKNIIFRNLLTPLGYKAEDILKQGEFGAVLARSGVGKTSILVQLAINAMLTNKNVLHISLADPVKKVNLWYREVFRHLAQSCDNNEKNSLLESILPRRFIMTFMADGFNLQTLENRITELVKQNIFSPQMVIIDGFAFDESARNFLLDLKALAQKHAMYIWFSMRTHRDEKPGPDGIPAPFFEVADMFKVAIQLTPDRKEIRVESIKGKESDSDHLTLLLDPATMMVKEH